MLKEFSGGNFECVNLINLLHLLQPGAVAKNATIYAFWQELNLWHYDSNAALQPTELHSPVAQL
jgi:hypothetical protein